MCPVALVEVVFNWSNPIHVNAKYPPEFRNPATQSVDTKDPYKYDWHCICPQKANYRTHFVGKWDVGMVTEMHYPRARLRLLARYWHHSNDYYTHDVEVVQGLVQWKTCGNIIVRLMVRQQCFRMANHVHKITKSQGETRVRRRSFCKRSVDIINKHDQKDPLFLFLLNAPCAYAAPGSDSVWETVRIYCGQI